MKNTLLLIASVLFCGASLAQEVGRVISATPVIQQIGQPRNICTTEQVLVQPPKSGAGALMGALAGGAVGHAVGGGSGRAAATMIGIMGGAIMGDSIEGSPMAQAQNVQHCSVQTFYENRAVAYDVVYEYAGKQYAVQMPNDPGPEVQLQIAPVGAITPHLASVNTYPQAVNPQPITLMNVQPVYPMYDQPLYYPPVQLNFGFRYSGRHSGHRHWR
jgi:uncharacterized protein YcfJ